MDWSVRDAALTLHHPGGDVYWLMPEGYAMPGAPLRSLAEYVLLSPYGEQVEVLPGAGAPGDRTAVAFSGGVDSAAALRLLDRPVPIYTQVVDPGGLHKTENALLAVQEVGGIAIRSNQDQLPRRYGRSRGFYGAAGFTTTSILLAEHLGLGTFADGNILEFTYLRTEHGHGTGYRHRDHSELHAAFGRVGLRYARPCAGLSEVSTTRIATGFRYAMGCMRGEGGEPCLRCMKCYRKMAIQGHPIPTNPEVERVLAKEWIPVLGALLWARDHHGLSHPRLDGVQRDYGWVDAWYPRSAELVPEQALPGLRGVLRDRGIRELEDDTVLRAWSSRVPTA